MTFGKPQSSKSCALGLFVALTVICGCKSKLERTDAGAASSATVLPAEPALALSPSRLEFGTLLPQQTAVRRVELVNPGTDAVHFKESASSSRCQWVEPLTGLQARAKVTREVRCQSDLQGPLKERLTLSDERPLQPPVVLELTGTVVPLLAFDTPFVDLRPDFGQTVHAEVSVVGAKVNDAKLMVEAAPRSVVGVMPLPVKGGQFPRFRLTCRADRVGMHAGSLVVKTGLIEPAVISVSWGCRVPGTLEVTPSNPYFNLKLSGDKAVTVEVKSTRRGFEVRSVHVKEGPFAASLGSSDSIGTYRVVVRVINEKILDETRAAVGTLVIESNDLREPHKEVPLFGFGQINKVEQPE